MFRGLKKLRRHPWAAPTYEQFHFKGSASHDLLSYHYLVRV
jgi:hypothetical protein